MSTSDKDQRKSSSLTGGTHSAAPFPKSWAAEMYVSEKPSEIINVKLTKGARRDSDYVLRHVEVFYGRRRSVVEVGLE